MITRYLVVFCLLIIAVNSRNIEESDKNENVNLEIVNSEPLDEENEIRNNEVNDLGKKRPNSKKNLTQIIQAEAAAYEVLQPQVAAYVDERFIAIYPGTKWCGAGDIASNYNDLGEFTRVDMCCRDHDHCPDYISAFSSKYGLFNYSPISKLLCACDIKFLECLKVIDSIVANNVGDIYFNVLGSQCFKREYPILYCKTTYPSSSRCKEYALDTKKLKKYQFFDTSLY